MAEQTSQAARGADTPPVAAAPARLLHRLRRGHWGWLGLLAPLLALAPLVWRLAGHAAAVLAYPWQIDYDEGIVLRAAWMIAQGQNPYHAPRPDAFTSATYPPLFYMLNAAWLWLSGPTLLSGRVIALAATLVVAALLAWWVWHETRSWLAGALTMALWLSLSPVYVWSTFFKPDLLALSLTLAGLVVARRWAAWPALAWAAPLFALAFFTKQSALVGPLAVGLWLLAHRGAWIRFGLVTGGLIAALFAAGNTVLRGGLWLHVVAFQQMPWSIGQLRHQVNKLVDTYPWLLIAAGLALLWLGVRGQGSGVGGHAPISQPSMSAPRRYRPPTPGPWPLLRWRWPFGLPVWYLLAVVPVVLVANGRINVNYGLLLDLFPPACLLIGIAAGETLGRPGHAPRGWTPAQSAVLSRQPLLLQLGMGAALSGLLLAQAIMPNPPGEWYSSNRMPSAQRARQMRNLADLVERTPGPILSEDLWLLLRVGQPVAYDDTFMMARMAQQGVWDERQLVADLEAQRFALVLLEYDITDETRSPRWSPTALAALRANYEILYRDVVFVHRPRSLLRKPGTPQDIVYGDQMRLVETGVSAGAARAGGPVQVMARWRRAAPPTADYTVFVHLVDPAGRLRAQVDVPPSAKPARAWTPDERAEAEYSLTLPEDAPPGVYRVLIGLYDPATGQRLAATRAGTAVGDAVAVAEVRVGLEGE